MLEKLYASSLLFLQTKGHLSICDRPHHYCSWFCCFCTSANRYWLAYFSISFSFFFYKSSAYRTWGKLTTTKTCVLNTENDRILLQHNGTLLLQAIVWSPSCPKSKYFFFLLVIKSVLQIQWVSDFWRRGNWNSKNCGI